MKLPHEIHALPQDPVTRAFNQAVNGLPDATQDVIRGRHYQNILGIFRAGYALGRAGECLLRDGGGADGPAGGVPFGEVPGVDENGCVNGLGGLCARCVFCVPTPSGGLECEKSGGGRWPGVFGPDVVLRCRECPAYEGEPDGEDGEDGPAPDPRGRRIVAVFHPQAWVKGYAVEVDPEGPAAFDVTDDVLCFADTPEGLEEVLEWEDDQTETDFLMGSKNAPDWVRQWGGPFWIEARQSIHDYFDGTARRS